MKFFVLVAALAISDAAFAQSADESGCKLVSEGNGVKVWQCAPTPIAGSDSK